MSNERAEGPPPLRADAERNRESILVAARQVFAESGSSASMNEIARRAGVNIATLFRRFPTRGELLAVAFTEKIAAYVDAMDSALSDPDAWHGFRTYLETAFEMQAVDSAFIDVLTMSVPEVPEFMAQQRRAIRLLPQLVERARDEGGLRPDVVHQDVALLLLSIAGVADATRESAPDAWRRVAALSIEGLRGGREQLPPAPSPQQLFRTFARERVAVQRSGGRSRSR